MKQENDNLRRLFDEQKTRHLQSESMCSELKKHCEELIQARSIEMSYLINRTVPVQKENVDKKNETKPRTQRQNPHQNKNLAFAMDINKDKLR